EAAEEPLRHAVHGADQRLRGLLGERDEAALDQPLSDPLAKLSRGLDRERRANHACRRDPVADARVLELLGQPVCLAAARAGADEEHMREVAACALAPRVIA